MNKERCKHAPYGPLDRKPCPWPDCKQGCWGTHYYEALPSPVPTAAYYSPAWGGRVECEAPQTREWKRTRWAWPEAGIRLAWGWREVTP